MWYLFFTKNNKSVKENFQAFSLTWDGGKPYANKKDLHHRL